MSITYPDLENDFPDIYSDSRTIFKNMTIDDVQYINQFNTLTSALLSASSDADRRAAWDAYNEFLLSENYEKHVEPCLISVEKLKTMEDMVISAQRFAKRVQQQWLFSETVPEDSVQAVGDMWGKIESIQDDGTFLYTAYQKTDSGYKKHENCYHGFEDNVPVSMSQAVDELSRTTNALENQLNGYSVRFVKALPGTADREPNTIYLVEG